MGNRGIHTKCTPLSTSILCGVQDLRQCGGGGGEGTLYHVEKIDWKYVPLAGVH